MTQTHRTLVVRLLVVGTLLLSAVASWAVTGAMSNTPGVTFAAALER